MTALSGKIQRPKKIPGGGLEFQHISLAGYTNYGDGNESYSVYEGAFMMCDVSDTDGYFSPIHGTPAAGDLFGGVAMQSIDVDSSLAADGAARISTCKNGVWGIPKGSVAITDLGATIYMTDDGTGITTASTGGIPIGTLEEVDTTYAWVNIANAFMQPKA